MKQTFEIKNRAVCIEEKKEKLFQLKYNIMALPIKLLPVIDVC